MMPGYGDNFWFNGQNFTASYYPSTITTTGTNVVDITGYTQQGIAPVLESPSRELSDRDWLDAQVEEVCAAA